MGAASGNDNQNRPQPPKHKAMDLERSILTVLGFTIVIFILIILATWILVKREMVEE